MKSLIKLNKPSLRIAHQSEVLQLSQQLAALQKEMKILKKQLHEKPSNMVEEKVVLPFDGGYHRILVDDILYGQAMGNYSKLYVRIAQEVGQKKSPKSIKTILLSKTLKSVLGLLPQKSFLRCHQSYFINKIHVSGYEYGRGLTIQMCNDVKIPVSRRNKKMVLEEFARV